MPPKTVKKDEQLVLWFSDISIRDVPLVGGKNASLGEMYTNLTKKGVRIPNGFALTANAYWFFLRSHGLDKKIKQTLKDLDVTDVRALARVGKRIREMILSAPLPDAIEKEILTAYERLSKEAEETHTAVAVRSSATAEDLPEASFAGQQETYLNIRGKKELLGAVRKCIASLFTNRAISYRQANGFDHLNVALSVTVQQMVGAGDGASGVMFTLDTESGFQGVVLINASYGLGEYVVKGRITPDQFYVFKEGLKQGKKAIFSRILGTKEAKLIYGNSSGTKHAKVPARDQNRFAIGEADVLQLARWGALIEEYYGKPQDIEWAKEGKTGELYIVQARPETVKARRKHSAIEEYKLKKKSTVLVQGIAIGQKIGAGKVRIINHPAQMKSFQKGEVLVTRMTDPDWEPIMRIASAIVTEQGGKTSHAAIVSREIGVPALVGTNEARKLLQTGEKVTVSCAEGEVGYIYKGILPFEVKRTEITTVPKTKIKIMMNVGDPDNAFPLSWLPNDGVGLAREEFIFSNFIRIHPLALLHYNSLKDKQAKATIQAMTRGYTRKTDYCVQKLAEGIARIAVAFYPNPVIIRFSDFKTNEYATLIGGREFEPKEENPMLGWRGASRYYSKEYKEGFKLECEAIKKVRNEWGLTNVITMVPFCRTPEEGEKVLETMAGYGLKQGENDLKVYVMCEIPSNVILAEEFAKIFDGFSIGSNDLTQLVLGVDRDSALVSHVYDERNEAVKTLIRDVIKAAHRHNKPVGICGQAPSDHPDFVEFLVQAGIDSISLNPDTVMKVRERVAFAEKTVGKTGKKTNPKYLGMVAALGIIAAGLISLGAGCGEAGVSLGNSTLGPSPAQLRQRVMKRVEEKNQLALSEKQAELDGHMTTLRETSFAEFSVAYPSAWTVEHWRTGVTMRNQTTGEYVSIFQQLVGHPVPGVERQPITVAGRKAVRYAGKSEVGAQQLTVLEIPLGKGEVLEINSNTDILDNILTSFAFTTDTLGLPDDRALNHWDIREKRFCLQVITYARPRGGECQLFPTPCDVPDGWQVCDEKS